MEDFDGDGGRPDDLSLNYLFFQKPKLLTNWFKSLQVSDPYIQELRSLAVENVEEERGSCLYEEDGGLYRRWRPPHTSVDEGLRDIKQLVVSSAYRQKLVRLAHDIPFAALFVKRKTLERLGQSFTGPPSGLMYIKM